MSVSTYYEKPGSAAVDSKGVRTYTRKFLFLENVFSDHPPVTWGAGGPTIYRYDPHPADSGARAISLSTNPTDVVGQYEVEVTYSSQPYDEGNVSNDPTQTDQSTVPTARPWVIKFGSVHGERLLGPKDLANKMVSNSAGQPFDPPPVIPCSNLQIQITVYKDPTWNAAGHIVTY